MDPVATGIPVLLNVRSGPKGESDGGSAIAAAFQKQGLSARLIALAPGQDIAATVDGLLDAGSATIVAAGGDGTVNAIAARLAGRDATLGILPMGTLNHFARDLGIPLELDGAVAVIAAGQTRQVDVGEVNDKPFLNNSSIGMYPRIVSEREDAQHRLGAGKWPALARATWHALRHPDNFSATVQVDGRTIERRTPFIFVGNNCYVLEGFGIGRRTCLDGGVLALYVLRPKSTLGLLWLGLRALLGIGSHAKDFDAIESTGFEVQGRHSEVEVATDGEVAQTAMPVRYRIRPRALKVLAPAPKEQG